MKPAPDQQTISLQISACKNTIIYPVSLITNFIQWTQS